MSLGSILSAIFLGAAAQKFAPPINNYFQGRRSRQIPSNPAQTFSQSGRSRQIPSSSTQTSSPSGRSRQIPSNPAQTFSQSGRSRQIPSSSTQTSSPSGRSRQIASAPGIKGRLRDQPANFGVHNQPIDPLLAFISQANKTGAVS